MSTVFTPKGLHSAAQGRASRTLGNKDRHANSVLPRRGYTNRDVNIVQPLRGNGMICSQPRVRFATLGSELEPLRGKYPVRFIPRSQTPFGNALFETPFRGRGYATRSNVALCVTASRSSSKNFLAIPRPEKSRVVLQPFLHGVLLPWP